MTKGLSKKLQRDDQRRKKRAQTATGFAQAAKTPPKAIPPSVGRATAMPEPLPPAHYPIKRAGVAAHEHP